MKTEEEVKARLAAHEMKLERLAEEWLGAHEELRAPGTTQQEHEYGVEFIREIDHKAECVANQITELKWWLGMLPSYELVPKAMQSWINGATKPEYLLKELKRYLDIQLNEELPQLHEPSAQAAALITVRLEELKQKSLLGEDYPKWMAHVPKEVPQEEPVITYPEWLHNLPDSDLEDEYEARKLDWFSDGQNEEYEGQYQSKFFAAEHERNHRLLSGRYLEQEN